MKDINPKTFLRALKKLSKEEWFQERFMLFLEESIQNYRIKSITTGELDEKILDWISSFITTQRNEKIDGFLGEE